jgi:beta-phosphoglucomutase-like phosphatase (HAD superfamily)
MLDKVKMALRITSAAFDDEINGLIAAAKADLRLVGVVSQDIEQRSEADTTASDPLILRAIILYAKAGFGYDDNAARYREAYDYLKCALSLAGDYNAVE